LHDAVIIFIIKILINIFMGKNEMEWLVCEVDEMFCEFIDVILLVKIKTIFVFSYDYSCNSNFP